MRSKAITAGAKLKERLKWFLGGLTIGLVVSLLSFRGCSIDQPLAVFQEETPMESIQEISKELEGHGVSIKAELSVLRKAHVVPTAIAVGSVVVAGDTTVAPAVTTHYTYLLDGRIPIASFDAEGDQFTFETYTLEVTSRLVGGYGFSSGAVQVVSSGDPSHRYNIPFTYELVNVTPAPRSISTSLTLGAAIALPRFTPTANLGLAWLHVKPNVDIVSPYVGFGENIVVGVEGVSVKPKIPLLSNTYFFTGYQYGDTHHSVSVGIRTNL